MSPPSLGREKEIFSISINLADFSKAEIKLLKEA
jgi:hypothetical protein